MTRPQIQTPALRGWLAELASGERTTQTFDALWRAACWEQSAVNAAALGLDASARQDLRRAAEILDEVLQATRPVT
jgi:hypothetical protein